jgi:hypothetical protein
MIIYGFNGTGSTSFTDCWHQNIVKTLPTTAVTIGISSNDAKDTAAGVGARTVKLKLLDGDFKYTEVTVSLAGTTEVNPAGTYLRFLGGEVLTVGSELDNAGIIYVYDGSDTVTAGVPQTATKIYGRMAPAENVFLDGNFTVPAGETWRVKRLMINGYDSTTTEKSTMCQMLVRKFGGVFQTIPLGAFGGGDSAGEAKFEWVPIDGNLVFTEKTDVKIQAKNSAAMLWGCIIEIEEW